MVLVCNAVDVLVDALEDLAPLVCTPVPGLEVRDQRPVEGLLDDECPGGITEVQGHQLQAPVRDKLCVEQLHLGRHGKVHHAEHTANGEVLGPNSIETILA